MASKFDSLEAEDRKVWRELYDYTTGGGTTPGHKPSSSASTPSGPTGPYDDPDIGKVAYDKYGRLIKPKKQNVEGGSKKPLLSRNTKATLWRRAGQVIGTAIGGGVLGHALGELMDPRARARAARYGTPSQAHTAPIPQAQNHKDYRLDEPDWSKKDMEKPFTKRMLDRAEELQVGKSRSDFSDDAKRARDDSRISKWIAPPDEDHEPEPSAP